MAAQVSSGVPSAEYLRSRGSALTRIMLTAFEDILSVGHDGEDDVENFERSHVNTAARQTAVDVATNKIIRAAEEYMLLTRTMKELWLFGGPDTLHSDQDDEEKEKTRQMRQDEKEVVEGMQKWLATLGERLSRPLVVKKQEVKESSPMSTG